jgi:hypothetical protein
MLRDELRLEITAISDHEWRVCDERIDADDPRRVMGYIERRGTSYEVLALVPQPRNCGSFPRWGAALQAVHDSRSDSGSGMPHTAAPAA